MECNDVLSLCDRFENYLTPLDIYVLRQRYNGLEFKSTYKLGREMKISDETVRTIEARALSSLIRCCDLRENGVKIQPFRLAKSFRQPVANLICQGDNWVVSCANYTAYQGELIIHAATKAHLWTTYPTGVIVGRALLLFCSKRESPGEEGHRYNLHFSKPQLFSEPIACTGRQAFFYIPREIAEKLPKRYKYTYQNFQ